MRVFGIALNLKLCILYSFLQGAENELLSMDAEGRVVVSHLSFVSPDEDLGVRTKFNIAIQGVGKHLYLSATQIAAEIAIPQQATAFQEDTRIGRGLQKLQAQISFSQGGRRQASCMWPSQL